MSFNLQPVLENEKAILHPLQTKDFEVLHAAASDPEIWEQHPNKDRWKKEIFKTFSDGAMQSKGAFRIVDKATGSTIGSTRIYNRNEPDDSLFISYTFYAKSHWGTGINRAVKTTMLDYVFQFVSKVYFHIGAANLRSQVAITRLGAKKIGEQEVTYSGEAPRLNFLYQISRDRWNRLKSASR